jgi:hypothetical protein
MFMNEPLESAQPNEEVYEAPRVKSFFRDVFRSDDCLCPGVPREVEQRKAFVCIHAMMVLLFAFGSVEGRSVVGWL